MPQQPYTEKCLKLLPSMGLELRQGPGVSDPTSKVVPYVCLSDSAHTDEREMGHIKTTFKSSKKLVDSDPSLGPATGCTVCFAQQEYQQRVSRCSERLALMNLKLNLDSKGPALSSDAVPYICLSDSSHTDERKEQHIKRTFKSSEELVQADPSLGPATGCKVCFAQQEYRQLVSRYSKLLAPMNLKLNLGPKGSALSSDAVPYVCLPGSAHTDEREMGHIKTTFKSSKKLVDSDPSLGPATGCTVCLEQQKYRQLVARYSERLRKMNLKLNLGPKGSALSSDAVPYVCMSDSSHTDEREMASIKKTFRASGKLVNSDPSLGPATGCTVCLEQQKYRQRVSRFKVCGWEYVAHIGGQNYQVACLGCGVAENGKIIEDAIQTFDHAESSLRAFNKNIDELRAKYEVPFPAAMQSRKGGCPKCTLTSLTLAELRFGYNLEPADPQSFIYQSVDKEKHVTKIELDLQCCLCSEPVSTSMANLRKSRSTWRTADGKRTGCENCYPRYNAMPNSVTWQQVQEEVESKYDRKFTGKLLDQFKPGEMVSATAKFKSVHNVCGKETEDTLAYLRHFFSPDSARCSHCAKSGYDPSKQGWLYVIWHPELQVWKIGISNIPEKRLSDHKISGFDVGDSAALIGPKEGYNGSEIASLEKELLAIAASEGAVSLKETGHSNLSRRGYTESWTAASFTPAHVGFGDTQALLDWLMDEYHRGLEQFAA